MVLPAELCNFSCAYCYEIFRGITINENIASGIVNFIKRNVLATKILEVSWFGGEPLITADRVIEISKICRDIAEENGIKFLSDITTNGYLLNRKIISKLIDAGINGFQITIDGVPFIHNLYRKLKNGKGTFSKIWTNIQKLKEIDENIHVVIRTNFDEDSYNFLDEWINLYQSVFGKDYRFKLVFRPVFRTGTERDKYLKFCDLKKSAEVESEILIKLWGKLGFPDWYFEEIMLPKPKTIYCYGGLPRCFIVGADGSLWKCTDALKEEDIIGNLNKKGEILVNNNRLIDWDRFTEQWLYDDDCKKCISLPLCMGGCILSRKRGKKGCYSSLFPVNKIMEAYYKKHLERG
ncbi:MAG: radical SAM protein [candidate division WOR-3 bacterium]|nr:radical SAM protein [candidate division WOR-3 bacterium]